MYETRVASGDWAGLTPGVELVTALTGVVPAELAGEETVDLMQARYRQLCHDQGLFYEAVAEVMLRDEPLTTHRMVGPSEFSVDEVRAGLGLTRQAAASLGALAFDLVTRLPQVHAAMVAGLLDQPRARVFSDWTQQLSDEQASAVCDRLLPAAVAGATTAQLAEKVKRAAVAIDPDWARRRYEQAVAGRRVVGSVNPDGSANLAGYDLPVDQVAAACARIDRLARAVKRAGHPAPVNHLRADLFLGMTDGSYAGMDEEAILAALIAAIPTTTDTGVGTGADAAADVVPATDPADAPDPADPTHPADAVDLPDTHDPAGADAAGAAPGTDAAAVADRSVDADRCVDVADPVGVDVAGAAAAGTQTDTASGMDGCAAAVDAAAQPVEQPPRRPIPATADAGPTRDASAQTQPATDRPMGSPVPAGTRLGRGVEIRVRLSTLLGHDQHPGELAGWGPIHAELARDLVTANTGGTWRYVLADDQGRLLHHGPLRRRPTGTTRVGTATVEIQIPVSTLPALTQTPPAPLDGWAPVIDEINHRHTTVDDQPNDPTRRTPGAALRRLLHIRNRTCIFPGCRVPAHTADLDHTVDHADGGPTTDPNLGPACRRDHRVKHDGGWQLHQPHPGHFEWTSRLGRIYHVTPTPVIEPLPDPVPRPDPPPPVIILTHLDPDTDILHQPPPPAHPPPPSIDDDPPF
jgi:Domain of unknown function (DUF222)